MSPLALIVATARNRVIGHEGDMPWHYPEDLAHFKAKTLGHPVIMGRRTFESIGRPLPKRHNIVVSTTLSRDDVEIANSLDKALVQARAASDATPFVIGGSALYAAAMPLATDIYLTRIDVDVPGDTFFPRIPESFRVVEEAPGQDAKLTFVHLTRS